MRAYHFCNDTLRDGRPIPPDGKWLTHKGPVIICNAGLHASVHPFDALQYAPGPTLCLVECEDVAEKQDDKFVCRRRMIVARFDATELLRAFARQCALDVIHIWNAPAIVRQYLETGDESLRDAAWDSAWAAARDAASAAESAAARDAAWAAAWAAARDAAWAAASAAARDVGWAAARAAARDAQKTKFAEMVNAKFKEMGHA